MNNKQIATGISFQPLADGTVLMEFHDDGGETINSQAISGDAFRRLPVVVRLTEVAVEQGVRAAVEIIKKLGDKEGQDDGCSQ